MTKKVTINLTFLSDDEELCGNSAEQIKELTKEIFEDTLINIDINIEELES